LVPWERDFYLFLNISGRAPTQVLRFQPASGALTEVTELDAAVIAAGTSICASTP
jgi:hypothetical protein